MPFLTFQCLSEHRVDNTESINNYGHDSHVSLYGNYHDDETGVFLDLNPKKDGWSEEVLKDNRREIVDAALSEDMFFRVSRNSHVNYNSPPQDLRTREEILEFIKNKAGTNEGKRVMIGRFLPEEESAKETVESYATELQFFHEYFFEDELMLGEYRTA